MPVFVTVPYLPKKDKLISEFNKIYKSKILTNYGNNVQRLEKKLQKRFKVKNVIAVANGTIGLQVALRALNINKEVITSPFSYVATASSICFNGAKPVFADIDANTFNISISNIQSCLSKKTEAILPVHVFGNINNINEINKIKKLHKLKVIYDASHCFDVEYKNTSVFNYGDCSVASFHATKIFHTIEGGAIFTNNNSLAKKIRTIINFGYFNGKIINIGINAKMNEFEAAMGLLNLEDIDLIKSNRKKKYDYYMSLLKNFKYQDRNEYCNNNYSYYPIVFKSEQILKKAIKILNAQKIYPRRYFYPSLNKINSFNCLQRCKESESLSKRILCLPLYNDLKKSSQDKIINILNSL